MIKPLPPRPPNEEETTISTWRKIMVWLGFLAVGIVALDVYLTTRFLRAPVPRAAQITPSPAENGRSARTPRATDPVTTPAVPPVPAGTGSGETGSVPSVVTAPEPVYTNTEPAEIRAQRLAAQAESLRQEVAERENDGSLLTPTKERVEQMIREGRELY
jgi:hypothetical protein